ncbi:hypothetical protein PoMZ_07069, partial [Pyricularia oryzae]
HHHNVVTLSFQHSLILKNLILSRTLPLSLARVQRSKFRIVAHAGNSSTVCVAPVLVAVVKLLPLLLGLEPLAGARQEVRPDRPGLAAGSDAQGAVRGPVDAAGVAQRCKGGPRRAGSEVALDEHLRRRRRDCRCREGDGDD